MTAPALVWRQFGPPSDLQELAMACKTFTASGHGPWAPEAPNKNHGRGRAK